MPFFTVINARASHYYKSKLAEYVGFPGLEKSFSVTFCITEVISTDL